MGPDNADEKLMALEEENRATKLRLGGRIIDLEADIAHWKALHESMRLDFTRAIDERDTYRNDGDTLRAQLSQAEAEAAAMRAALEDAVDLLDAAQREGLFEYDGTAGQEFDENTAPLRAALASNTGKAVTERLEAVERERDAYKKAKAENDDRFMGERDDARAERDALKAQVMELQATEQETRKQLVEQEREECAKLADAQRWNTNNLTSAPPQSEAARFIAIAIRKRSERGQEKPAEPVCEDCGGSRRLRAPDSDGTGSWCPACSGVAKTPHSSPSVPARRTREIPEDDHG